MSNVDSPAVARRRVRLALRAARLAKKLTQSQVAKAMDWSLSKVIRIEKGEVNVSPSDLKVLLEHLDITDPNEVEELLDDVRLSRTERWTITTEEREHLTPAMLALAQFEADAVAVRYYTNFLIPGPLQTVEYARAHFTSTWMALDPETIEARIAERLRRREALETGKGPALIALLDESVLARAVVAPSMMAVQLRVVSRLMSAGRVHLRVVPMARPSYQLGPFVLLDLEPTRSAAVYREDGLHDEFLDVASEVERHRAIFDDMWARALNDHESAELVNRQLAEFAAGAE